MPATDPSPARTRARPVDPRLLRYATASRGFFVAIAAISLAQTLVIVLFAALLTRAITGAIDGMPADELATVLAMLGGAVVVRAALLWIRELVCTRAAARVQAQLRAQLVSAVAELGPAWLVGQNTARLAVIAGRGLEALDAYFARYLPQLMMTMIATPILVVFMWSQDWISGLTVVVTIPLIPVFMVLIGLATRAVQQAQWKTLGTLAARFADTVRGLSTLKIFGRQFRAVSSIAAVTAAYRRETMRVLRVSFLSGFALELLASISVAIVAVSVGFRLIDGSLALAVGLFVLLLAPEAYLPLRQVGVQFHAAAEGVAATDDVFGVLDAAADRRAAPVSPRVHSTSPGGRALALVVRDLRVKRGQQLLAPVGFTADAGTVTLLEGSSGSGKTSILAVLRGAADAEGAVEFDGHDVRTLAPSRWLAWAGQQPGLVSGTIAQNIRLGEPPASAADADPDTESTSERVRRALALAQAPDLDADQELGVQGAGLSGGQAQRVAVARAIYRHLSGLAPVIALDEPSAALDADTEAGLWRALRSLADAGAIVLLVSHRSTARAIADTVVTLHGMEVVV